ncbi:MAG: YcgN family cysteine cluster protein [Proteobacteria bacterium]|nr:YcgN family cysteine cluster protein [Pseudomonadota bacterium]
MTKPFWRAKSLAEMSASEWESLCDGCGRCCLVKLEDEDTGEIYATDIACRLFDEGTCRCRDYENRSQIVTDCVRLTPEVVPTLNWLPVTCAYRLVHEKKDLPWWHPLVSGRAETVVDAGISVLGKTAGLETEFTESETIGHIVRWPNRWPKARKPKV